jgi:hypothetical protein
MTQASRGLYGERISPRPIRYPPQSFRERSDFARYLSPRPCQPITHALIQTPISIPALTAIRMA